MAKTATYRAWAAMFTRCYNTNYSKYLNYGGRGISVDKNWSQFSNFLADMGERPGKRYSLDRIDVNGNYCKENCRWATMRAQNRNKRNNLLLQGKTLSEWSEILGVKRSTLSQRYYVYKWSVDRILNKLS
jgi:hypothetical protein